MIYKNRFKQVLLIVSLSSIIILHTSGCGSQEVEVMSQSVVEEETPIKEATPTTKVTPVETNKEEPVEEGSVSENDISTSKNTEEKGEDLENYTLTEMDTQMLVTQQAYTYEQPSSEALKIGAVQADEVVHIIGQVNNTNWFKISQEGDIHSFIDGTMLTDYIPEETVTSQEQVQQQQQQVQQLQQQQVQEQTAQQEQQVQQQEQVQQQQVQEQPVQQEQPENTLPAEGRINPATGQPYKPGDIVAGGVWVGDATHELDQYW